MGPPAAAAGFDPAAATWLLREAGSGIRATLTALLAELPGDPPRLVLGSHAATIAATDRTELLVGHLPADEELGWRRE